MGTPLSCASHGISATTLGTQRHIAPLLWIKSPGGCLNRCKNTNFFLIRNLFVEKTPFHDTPTEFSKYAPDNSPCIQPSLQARPAIS